MRFIIWSADNQGPTFTEVEGDDLGSALWGAGLCGLWFDNGQPTKPITRGEQDVPGAWDLGDDAAFDVDVAEAMIELGRCIVEYIRDVNQPVTLA